MAFRAVPSPAAPATQQPIRMVTYNILADKYSSNNSYCPKQWLNWPYRCQLLLQQLGSYAPDLLCLQEVQQDVYREVLQPWMRSHGYGSVYNPRPAAAGSSTRGPLDGVSLHFKHSMFSLQASQQVRFADHVRELLPGTCCSLHHEQQDQQLQQQQHYDFMQALLQRQEGAVMALLQHKPSQQQLVACSTHLHWNPNFPDIKLAQASILCHSISSFIQAQQQQQQPAQQPKQKQQAQQQKPQRQEPKQQQQPQRQQGDATSDVASSSSDVASVPVVVGGDFNSLPRKYLSDVWDKNVPRDSAGIMSGVYQLMSEGSVGPSHRDHPANRTLCRECSRFAQQQGQHELLGYTFTSCGLELESSQFSALGREPTLTTRTSSFSGCLDYLWLSKQHWSVQSTLEMPFDEPPGPPGPPQGVTTLGTCPNAEQPSDHLAVGCEAQLLPVAGGASVGAYTKQQRQPQDAVPAAVAPGGSGGGGGAQRRR